MNTFTFNNISYQEWIDSVPKELISSLDNHSISPFSHSSRVDDYEVLEYNHSASPWQVMHYIDIKKGSTNKDLLKLLNLGVNSLILNIEVAVSESEWKDLLEGIRIELIYIHLQGNLKGISAFIKFCELNNLNIRGSYQVERGQLTANKFENFVPLISSNGSFENEIAEILVKCYEEYEKNGIQKITFGLQVNDHYLHNIAAIYALKIVWIHFIEFMGIELTLPEILTFNKYKKDDSFEHYCIKSTLHVASSISGGANGTYLQNPVFPHHDQTFTSRIITNIHFLCHMEGKMDKVLNPLEGSYYIEELSNHIAQSAWEIFQKSLVK